MSGHKECEFPLCGPRATGDEGPGKLQAWKPTSSEIWQGKDTGKHRYLLHIDISTLGFQKTNSRQNCLGKTAVQLIEWI